MRRWIIPSLVAAFVWLVLLSFPFVPKLNPDSSWQIVLNEAWTHRRVFGRDIVFTYGPWGWLTTRYYFPDTFGCRVAWDLAWNAAAASLLVGVAWALPLWRRILFIAAAVLILPIFENNTATVVIAALSLWCLRAESPSRTALILAGGFLGFLSLQKFTYLILSGFGISGVILRFLIDRRARPLAFAGGNLAGFVLGWLLAFQPLSAIPAFLIHSLWIVAGYGPAMALNETITLFALGVSAVVAYLLLVWARPRFADLPRNLLLTAFGFLIWKHGFVRADGHTLGFFSCVLFAGLAAPLLARASIWRNLAAGLLVILSLAGLVIANRPLAENLFPLLRMHLQQNAESLLTLRSYHSSLDAGYAQLRASLALPAVRAAVGSATIDQLGYQQLVVVANNLNYDPRPVFQGYQAYSHPLSKLNADFYRSPQAPEFVLARLESIDGRYPPIDEAELLPVLLNNYRFILSEKNFLLLHRESAHSTEVAFTQPALASGRLRYHTETCPIPTNGAAVWARIDTPLSWLGWIRAILYKPPQVRLVLRGATGKDHYFRLISNATRAGFLISPLLANTADLEQLMSHDRTCPAQSFRIEIGPANAIYFLKRARYELFALPASAISTATFPNHSQH